MFSATNKVYLLSISLPLLTQFLCPASSPLASHTSSHETLPSLPGGAHKTAVLGQVQHCSDLHVFLFLFHLKSCVLFIFVFPALNKEPGRKYELNKNLLNEGLSAIIG